MIKINFANAGQPAINDTNLNQMQDNIETAINGAVSGDTLPIGSQIPYGNALAPSNWLICDGSVVSRTEYAELFAVIGTSYGVGDGSTTFNLPDKRKRTSVGLDTSDTDFNAIGKKLGEKEHTLTTDELPSNIGTFRALAWSNGTDNTTGMFSKEIIANDRWADPGTDFGTRKYSLSGGNQPHNNMQPSEVDNWIIKAKQSAGMVATVVDNLTSISETDALSAKQGKVLNEKIEQQIITDEEFETNEFIDGKKVYAKRIIFYGASSNRVTSIAHSITGFEDIWVDIANSYVSHIVGDKRVYPLIITLYENVDTSDFMQVNIDENYVNLISIGGWSAEHWKFVVVIKYTKS